VGRGRKCSGRLRGLRWKRESVGVEDGGLLVVGCGLGEEGPRVPCGERICNLGDEGEVR
jgi:hypothetical protein